MYCKNRGGTTCCFHQHECEASWKAVNVKFPTVAVNYLKDKVALLEILSYNIYFSSCKFLYTINCLSLDIATVIKMFSQIVKLLEQDTGGI